MRTLLLMAALLVPLRGQTAADWALNNFAERLEVEIANPSSAAVDTVAVIPVAEAAKTAPRFPGTLAIAVVPGKRPVLLASQADDLDGDGNPDEFVFAAKLGAGERKTVHIYYSTTLRDFIPWPKQVHASHAFGYNRATVALESEAIGYRTYGGFFLDIQARAEGHPGLYNSLVGYLGSATPNDAGRDVIHLGDTLGLGGLYLRAGGQVWRPPVNMPDYAHKPEVAEAPRYRVIASGPIRALVEARIDNWTIGGDAVDIRAWYSVAAGSGSVECRFDITPRRVSREYEVGAGIRQLPQMSERHAPGRLALAGTQTPLIGEIGLALYYDPKEAAPAAQVVTKDGANDAVAFRGKLAPGAAVHGRYQLAGAWSGSGIRDLLGYLAAEAARAQAAVRVGGYRFARTPKPERVEGEAY